MFEACLWSSNVPGTGTAIRKCELSTCSQITLSTWSPGGQESGRQPQHTIQSSECPSEGQSTRGIQRGRTEFVLLRKTTVQHQTQVYYMLFLNQYEQGLLLWNLGARDCGLRTRDQDLPPKPIWWFQMVSWKQNTKHWSLGRFPFWRELKLCIPYGPSAWASSVF